MQLLKFSTPSCTYCKVVEPHINKYAEKNGYKVIEINANSDTNSSIDKQYTEQYEVMSVPTVIVIIDMQPIKQAKKLVGFHEIMSFIKG